MEETMPRASRTVLAAFAVVLGGMTAGCAASMGDHGAATRGPQETAQRRAGPADLEISVGEHVAAGDTLRAGDLDVQGARSAAVTLVRASAGRLRAATGLAGRMAIGLPAYSARSDEPIAVMAVRPRGGWMTPVEGDVDLAVDLELDKVTSGTKRDNGDNVLQRGLYVDEAQYKLQVDHHRPSCLMRGVGGQVLAQFPEPLEPEQWYRIRCTRHHDEVRLAVSRLDEQGSPLSTRTRVAHGEIGPMEFPASSPMSIGGKLTPDGSPAAATDQFNGLLDRVRVSVR
jgi:hypothetical protein